MKTSALKLLFASALFGICLAGHAQSTAFTYQGRLNTNGVPVTGAYDFQFYLRDALTAGNPVGTTNTQIAVGVTNGLFTTTLDFGAGIFTGAGRWLEIGVRTNGSVAAYTTLSPRQPLLPVPYAITASNLTGTLPATQLSGALPSAQLSGSYAGAISLNNAANTLAGNGSGLTSLNAGNIASGTVADGRLSSNVALRNATQTFTGVNTFSNLISSAGGVRLNDGNIWLRGGSDVGHGLAYNGGAVTNFGNGNVQVDGPVLWGYGGGALGTYSGGTGPHAVLTWTPQQVLVNGSVQASGPIQANGGLIIENRTSDPTNAVTGQIWLRTDL